MTPANVTWNTPSTDSTGSMPLGNGDLGLNVWAQADGRLRCYLGKTDAWDELGRLVKVGAFDLSFSPNPFVDGAGFVQTLVTAAGCIEIRGGGGFYAKVWVDAHSSTVVIEGRSRAPLQVTVELNVWRRAPRLLDPQENNCAIGLRAETESQGIGPDTVAEIGPDVIAWFHRNTSSVWPSTLDHQALGFLKESQTDPLLHRTFGAAISGPGFRRTADTVLTASAATFTLHVHALTLAPATAAEWQRRLRQQLDAPPPDAAKHQAWWTAFWARSWIAADGAPEAEKVTQAYALQRFVFACQGRGAYPMKFNGGIFTMDVPLDGAYNADYRRWGGAYWFQNTRLLYWPLLNAGDFEMIRPLFDMYLKALPLAEARVRHYFGHAGACFPETMTFWGSYLNANYGYDRAGKAPGEVENRYIRHYWQGGLELLYLGLDVYDFTRDENFLSDTLLRLAVPILRFYVEHYPRRDDDGKILFTPAQALETWHDAVNPLPEIAGLTTVLDRLLKLDGLPAAEAAAWRELRALLPAVPKRTWFWEKRAELIPAQQYDQCCNFENVALYAVFPYRLYGVGKPELPTGRDTYAARPFKVTGCWRQDAIQAALLGLAEAARSDVAKNATDFTTVCRFPAFWDANSDWVPDEDHGGVTMTALQRMLLQADAGKIHLLPAWPKAWDVSFKLAAPDNTTVSGEVTAGILTHLQVTPESRRCDLVIHEPQ